MKKEINIVYKSKPLPLHIDIVPPIEKVTWWDRFKTKVWNFILPPHLRLKIIVEAGE